MNQILTAVPDESTDEDTATGATWRFGMRRPRIKHLAEVLEAHGYTLRRVESRSDKGLENLRP
jgi:hypothetical protein